MTSANEPTECWHHRMTNTTDGGFTCDTCGRAWASLPQPAAHRAGEVTNLPTGNDNQMKPGVNHPIGSEVRQATSPETIAQPPAAGEVEAAPMPADKIMNVLKELAATDPHSTGDQINAAQAYREIDKIYTARFEAATEHLQGHDKYHAEETWYDRGSKS